MPIKWYGNGDSEDPIYKHFSRIVNFVIHCMIFTAIVSGTWLFKEIKHDLVFFNNFAIAWAVILSSHLLFVFIKKPKDYNCLLYTSPSPRDQRGSRMPSSA